MTKNPQSDARTPAPPTPEGTRPMPTTLRNRTARALAAALAAVVALMPAGAQAGQVAWLDEVVQQVVREAELGARAAGRAEAVTARTASRLFAREADQSLTTLARRSDDLARVARRAEEPAEAALHARFDRLLRADAGLARTFSDLAPAEKRLVVEMGEAAQGLARRYPGQAETMIRRLGVEGLAATRAFGDDVAEVLVKEGPEAVDVLRKTGRPGWKFFTETVLPHKGKLAAAGVFALYLANPEQFVDSAGRATQYAVEQFARAGIAIGGGVVRGLDAAAGGLLTSLGLDSGPLRGLVMAVAALVALLALMSLVGLPLRWALRPITGPIRWLLRRPHAA